MPFVCPTNKRCQEINGEFREEDSGIKAVTVNHLFGMGATGDSRSKRFDSSAYDVVIFDEIFLMDTRKLARINEYIQANPGKIALATGDTDQLEPVEPATHAHEDLEAYSNSCVDLISRTNSS